MIKIAICDDEAYFRKQMKEYLETYMHRANESFEIDLFETGKELLDAQFQLYQIIFLDINMRGLDGLETAKKVREICKSTYLVFVTAYLDYTLEGYKVEAFRYLLKRSENMEEQITECMKAIYEKRNVSVNRMMFCFLEGKAEIVLENLVYVESRLHRLEFHVRKEEECVYTMYGKLDDVEKQLEKQSFVRIHQSFLVNMKHIKKVERYRVVLKSGKDFTIPRARYRDVNDIYVTFRGEM